ncbi:hypothetical protein SAMN05192564_106260 [Paraburkholderia sartisoli]|uniref:Uncharacterized protein n=1 Tax=Paraburkholderia sartisoli TaxID=83784 RepID=A0A1H4GR13_9BURK|nr:hypothetical protein SAMN05192564_106260 [Paraburkholderia sartisoli]
MMQNHLVMKILFNISIANQNHRLVSGFRLR